MKKILALSLLFGGIAAGGFGSENDGIFSVKVGQFEVYMLVETTRAGNTGILLNVDQAFLNQYIPENGFSQSTNTFLVKTLDRIILVDTGFGGAVFEKMKKLGVEPGQVDAILLTHLHGDHIGGLQKNGKAMFPKAAVYLSSADREFFTATRINRGAVDALSAYGNMVKTFVPNAAGTKQTELLPGIVPIAAYGHTPGHTAYLLENAGERLLIAGDFLHIGLVQFPAPQISASYDADPAAAAVSRRQLMDYAARNKIRVGGMHMVYPAVGTVETSGEGFRFIPAE